MSRVLRYGLLLLSLAIFVAMTSWTAPLAFLLAHLTRLSALWLAVIGGLGLGVIIAVLYKVSAPPSKIHKPPLLGVLMPFYCLAGLFYTWLLHAKISDFAHQRFTAFDTPAALLQMIVILACCCSVFFTEGLYCWRAWRQARAREQWVRSCG